MPSHRIEFTVPQEMWDRIEAARGDISRAAFIKVALSVYMASPWSQLLEDNCPDEHPS